MHTRIVNYKNALTCKVMILKKAIAEGFIQNVTLLCDYLLKWHDEVKGLPCDYPTYIHTLYILYIYYKYVISCDCFYNYKFVENYINLWRYQFSVMTGLPTPVGFVKANRNEQEEQCKNLLFSSSWYGSKGNNDFNFWIRKFTLCSRNVPLVQLTFTNLSMITNL